MVNEFIPVFDCLYNSNEEKYLTNVIRSGRISSQGDYVFKFEEAFAKFNNTKHAISVANGTVALETAYFAVGLTEGDEIIMPSFTIISCAIGAIRLGSIPVFVDVDPLTWCIDVNLIEQKITKKTKAILAVHMYGHPCDMDKIMSIAEKYNLVVIEDASQVHGGEYKKKKCGSIGHISTFSFYANKIISTGEGGMIITSDESYAQKCRDYRNLCFIPEKRFFHNVLSNNYRLGALQAAVGLAQLEKIEEHVELKIKNGLLYKKYLSNISDLQLQTELPYAKMVYWMYCVVLPDQFINTSVSEILLKEYQIETRPFFIGLHEQPAIINYLKSRNLTCCEKYPVTELISKRGFYLPSGFTLLEDQIKFICDSLKKTLSR
jgi:perosamine synthetase